MSSVAAAREGLTLDVVMPVLNEVARAEGAILSVLEHAPKSLIVVDGGSVDGTKQVVARLETAHESLHFLMAERGRASQMNAGAARSTADILLFLHCDAILPDGALKLAKDAMADREVVGGAFVVRTLPDGPRHWSHRLLWLADIRSRYTRFPYGDQAVFVRRSVFESLGGFPDVPMFEDLKFSQALAQRGRLARLRAPVRLSGRRFRDHPVRTGVLMNVLPTLARFYRPVR